MYLTYSSFIMDLIIDDDIKITSMYIRANHKLKLLLG